MPKRVLVQMGHVAPRDPNHENETGANGEQDLVRLIGPRLRNLLNADPRFECVLVPGLIGNHANIDAAIFLHGDGSGNPQTRGFSYGYPEYAINRQLRDLLRVEYEKIPGHPPHFRDNYTGGLRGYYGYGRVQTPGPEVLVEHGFLSNAQDRAWMFANVDRIAQAHYRALLAFYHYAPIPPPPTKPYRLVKIRKDGTTKIENVGRVGAANVLQLFLRGQFREIRLRRL